jgi:two-component system chemotaxis response regulator CheY
MKHILVVDDDPTILSLVVEVLSGAGYQVSAAEDGLQAMDSLAGGCPDLIITDVNMPVIDGGTLVGIMRAREETRYAPVLGITALTDLRRANDAYFTDIIHKPFDIDDLVETVDRLLGHRSRV